jgi:hypothetical protein
MATILAQQSRAAGTYSGILTVPGGAVTVSAAMLMTAAIAGTAANQATITVEGEWTAGLWEPIFGPNDWTGGGVNRAGQPVIPSFTYSTSAREMPGRMRGTVTTNRTYSWGLDVTIT